MEPTHIIMQGINTAIQKNPDFIFLQEAINEINVDNYTYDVKGSGSERMGILSKTGNTWEMTSSEIINTNNADSDSNKCNTQRDEIIYTITHTSDNTNIKIANVHLVVVDQMKEHMNIRIQKPKQINIY